MVIKIREVGQTIIETFICVVLLFFIDRERNTIKRNTVTYCRL